MLSMLSNFITVLVLWYQAIDAVACTVCGFGNDPAKGAFLATTGIMTFVPLIMLGATVWYVWRRTKLAGATSKDANSEAEQTPT